MPGILIAASIRRQINLRSKVLEGEGIKGWRYLDENKINLF